VQVKNYSEIEKTHFDNEAMKGIEACVVIGKKDGAENFCMRVFEVEPGGHTPKHAHDWEHEIFVHSGEGEAYGNGVWNPFKAGAALFVPANEEHQIRNSGSQLLTFVCLIPSKAPEL